MTNNRTIDPDWPGGDKLPPLARVAYEGARALEFGEVYALRAAAGAVLAVAGPSRNVPEVARRGGEALLQAVNSGDPNPWAAFVVAVLV